MEESEKKRILSRQERQEQEMQRRLDRLQALRGDYIDEVRGYVYRDMLGFGRVSLPPVDEVLDDDQLGRLYGPGKYRVVYRFTDLSAQETDDDGNLTTRSTVILYNIGPEYYQIHKEDCRISGRPCYIDDRTVIPGKQESNPLSSFLQEDKIKSVVALLGGLKMILNPQQESNSKMETQLFKLLEVSMQPKPAAGVDLSGKLLEAAVSNLLNPPNKKSALAEVREQMELFQEVQETFDPEARQMKKEKNEKGRSGMIETMLEKAMELLPAFLDKFGGNEAAAARALKQENPAVKMLLHSKAAQKAFYSQTAAKFGKESADRWAAGFGVNPSNLHAAEAQVVKTINGNSRPAPAAADSGIMVL